MKDTFALPAALRAALVAGTIKPDVEAARSLYEIAGARGLDELALLAGDDRLSVRQRAVVLLAIAFVLAEHPETPAPDAALDAIEHTETMTAAIETGLGAALTGVLAAAPLGGSLRATRQLIGRRLLAAGDNGPHVVRLLVDSGDVARAAEAAAADLAAYLPRALPCPETWARVRLVVEWSESREFFAATMRNLAVALPDSLDLLTGLLQRLPTTDPGSVARARAGIVWALDPQ